MDATANPLDALVDAILQSYGQLALVLDHMLRASAASGGEAAEPIPDVLRRLLGGALTSLAERRGDLDVAITAEVLAAATEVIGRALYLVPIEDLTGSGSWDGSAPRSPRPGAAG
jgi:hypothetical protein